MNLRYPVAEYLITKIHLLESKYFAGNIISIENQQGIDKLKSYLLNLHEFTDPIFTIELKQQFQDFLYTHFFYEFAFRGD